MALSKDKKQVLMLSGLLVVMLTLLFVFFGKRLLPFPDGELPPFPRPELPLPSTTADDALLKREDFQNLREIPNVPTEAPRNVPPKPDLFPAADAI